ncbi:HIT family protein [Fimbriimonas ginsengisoli]|uniref:Hit family protein n=1 Tax=Fimbriimonas ginsengisoli Gsoil 348 TaxID=661478 RepID=A0A068NPU5_FIMGI|nr:HIT domain-containing protein [Fimbriimonas ginsengisoli]AIE84790.1 hit family protein [Fimbriimonas ginsengisoli Gsoil 348]
MQEILWAPWRLQYIEKPSVPGGTGDIFLDLPAAGDDKKNLILYRGTTGFVMMNAFPYTNGHLLIAPFRQVAEIDGLNEAELCEINMLLAKCVRWVRAAYNPDGFNVGVNMGSAAGAGIPVHIHWHVVPRWAGDTNFMTSVGEVRVMPQTLEDSYARLAEVIARDV